MPAHKGPPGTVPRVASSCYPGAMTTAMKYPTVLTGDLDFKTRLMGASLAMDVSMDLAAGPALEEAQAAVQRARERGLFEQPAYKPNPILKAAADLIRDRGWARGEYEVNGRLCALGAIRTASRGDDWPYMLPVPDEEHHAVVDLMTRVAREFGPATSIPKWNDSRSDVGEVLRLLY